MYKYVVALYSNFDGSMKMDEVFAKSDVEAGKQFLISEGDTELEDLDFIKTYAKLQEYVFDTDHAIGVYKVTSKTQSTADKQVAAILKH